MVTLLLSTVAVVLTVVGAGALLYVVAASTSPDEPHERGKGG
jgi:hypothetical protein